MKPAEVTVMPMFDLLLARQAVAFVVDRLRAVFRQWSPRDGDHSNAGVPAGR